MPAPWSAGARLRIRGKLHGQDCQNVMHFATNTQILDPSDLNARLQQLVVAMLQCLSQLGPPFITSDWTLEAVEAHQIHPATTDVISQAPDGAVQGALGPTSVSFAASLCQVRTGFSSKTKRGRNFYPPPGEANITNSLMDQSAADPFIAFLACVAEKFIGAGATTIWRLGVLSRKKVGEPPVSPTFDQAFTEALSLVPSRTIARMGSRKVGKGS